MAVDYVFSTLLFIGAMLGVLIKSGAPFIATQIAKGKELEALEERRPDTLTEDEKWQKEQLSKPFKFSKYYVWTAIGSFLSTFVFVLSAYTSLVKQAAGMDYVVAFVTAVLMGIGANWLGNQLVKSENVSTILARTSGVRSEDTAKSMVKKVKEVVVPGDGVGVDGNGSQSKSNPKTQENIQSTADDNVKRFDEA